MLTRNFFRANNLMKANVMKAAQFNPRFMPKSFSSDVGISDMPDVFKVNYTEEFDQGLTED